jgi:hypothetical protein
MDYRQRCAIVMGGESGIDRICAQSPARRRTVAAPAFCDSEAAVAVAARERIVGTSTVHDPSPSHGGAGNDGSRRGLAQPNTTRALDHAPQRLAVTAIVPLTIDGALLLTVALGA